MLVRILSIACGLILAPLTVQAAAPPRSIDQAQLQSLLQRLDDDDFAVRQSADAALRDLGKQAIPHFKVEMRRTKSLEVRWRLDRIVQALTLDERVEALVRQLATRDPATRERAAWSLRQAGPGVVPLLQRELRSELPLEQRTQVQRILAELGTVRR